jgi:hypothetical protein
MLFKTHNLCPHLISTKYIIIYSDITTGRKIRNETFITP